MGITLVNDKRWIIRYWARDTHTTQTRPGALAQQLSDGSRVPQGRLHLSPGDKHAGIVVCFS